MQISIAFPAIALSFLLAGQCAVLKKHVQSNAPDWDPRLTPFPPARRDDIVHQYRSEAAKGNVSIPDPYNYFETSDASDFINAQLDFTKTYLDKLQDVTAITAALKDADTYNALFSPYFFGPKDDPTYLYYDKQPESTFWRSFIAKQKDLDKAHDNFANLPGKLLVDDSLLGGKITFQQQLSPDGTKLLYTIGEPDTYANMKVFVRDVSNPLTDKSKPIQEGGYDHYPDVITDFKWWSEVWSGDSKSIFYTSSDGSIRYHVLGTDVKEDPIIVKPIKEKKGEWVVQLSDDHQHIILFGSSSDDNSRKRIYIASLEQKLTGPIKWFPFSTDYDFYWEQVTNIGQDFYFSTDKNAPNQQIVRVNVDFTKAILTDDMDIFTKDATNIVTVIPQRTDTIIADFGIYDNDKILLIYDKDDAAELFAFSLTTGAQLQQLSLDTLSTSVTIESYSSSTNVYLQVTSLVNPSQFYHLKWNKASNLFSSKLVYQQKNGDIDPNDYTLERKWAPSKTGNVKIPFYVLYRKGLKFDGSHPVIINFFGALGFSYPSWYDSDHLAFVRCYDAVYILAAPRGGGELGEDWHKAGQLQNKQNTIDDIITIAQYAIDQKWTSPGKVILDVLLSGVLTAAAVVNQAPEGLIGAFLGAAGLFDLLRSDQSSYDKNLNAKELGSPSDPKAFDWLRKYLPLQNIDSRKTYPTILIYPINDNGQGKGAEPWHTYKYIAELQHELPNNPNPILLGNSTESHIERTAIGFALVAHTLGLKLIK